jgi:L-serine deaminase
MAAEIAGAPPDICDPRLVIQIPCIERTMGAIKVINAQNLRLKPTLKCQSNYL